MTRPVPWWARALALVALVAAAFSAGRFSAPLEVDERVETKVVYRDRIVEKRVEAAARVETRVVYRDRIVKPDGTKIEREIEKSDAAQHVEKKSERNEERLEARTIEVIKRVEVRPNWRVAASVGGTLREPLVPLAGPLVVGIEIDRRISGGLSLGVWASTQGAAGLTLSFEF
jgi:hypothetical protein